MSADTPKSATQLKVNPLASPDPKSSSFVEDAAELVEVLVDGDGFLEESARDLLTGLIVAQVRDETC